MQELLRRVPVYVIWDDHDSADNSWKNGSWDTYDTVRRSWNLQRLSAPNHMVLHSYTFRCAPAYPRPFANMLLLGPRWAQEVWAGRKSSAATAFKNYLPVRSEHDDLFSLYRAFTYGDMATVVLPETRCGVDEAAVLAGQHARYCERPKAERNSLGILKPAVCYQSLDVGSSGRLTSRPGSCRGVFPSLLLHASASDGALSVLSSLFVQAAVPNPAGRSAATPLH